MSGPFPGGGYGMDKRELRKLPVIEATGADAELAKRMPCLE